MPKFTILATASPRQNQTKIQKGGAPNTKNGRETKSRAGDETLGGKRNSGPHGVCLAGCQRRWKSREHELHVKSFPQRRACLPRTGSASAPRGLHGAGAMIACIRPEPVHAKIECDILHHRVVSLQQKQERNVAVSGAELRPVHSRRQDGIEIVREGDAAFALWHEKTRRACAPGTRRVVLPGSRLHEASPTGPGSPRPEPLCPGFGVLPEAILRRPGTKQKCPFCPQISTPPRSWRPPNSALRAYNRFYTSGSALSHPRSWSIFRHFGRENLAVMPKYGVLLFTHHSCHDGSPTKPSKNTKGRGLQI